MNRFSISVLSRHRISRCLCLLAMAAGFSQGRAATLYVAVNGAGNGSSPASPLPSVAAAYAIANQGDFIEMAAGTYNSQPTVAKHTAADSWAGNVTVQPASGATVTIGNGIWAIRGSHITLKNLRFTTRVTVDRGADYFRLEGCYLDMSTGASNASLVVRCNYADILDNLFNGGADCDAIQVSSGTAASQNHHILIEGNVIQDYLYAAGGDHEDGIQMYDCTDVTIRNNIIRNVGNSCIIFSPGNGGQIKNVLIENNLIRDTSSSIGVDSRQASSIDIVIINNTIQGNVNAISNAGCGLRNNIIAYLSNSNSPDQYNYIAAWNAGAGVVPSPTSRTGPMPAFVDEPNGDLHISQANTVDLAFGLAAGAPATDIDGQLRGTPVGVGADVRSWIWEAEAAPVTAATDALTVFTETEASEGAAEKLESNAAGDHVSHAIWIAQPGTCSIKTRVKTHSSRGKFQLAVDGVDQGVVQDLYSAGNAYAVLDLGTRTFNTAGSKSFKFTVTGRNAGSSGYTLAFDYLQVVPTIWEAERIPATATDAVAIFYEAEASAGAAEKLESNAAGDFVSHVIPVIRPGTYSIKVRAKKHSSRGKFQLAIDGADQGSEQDLYAAGNAYVVIDLGTRTFSTAGGKEFKFTVTGRNAGSSGYSLAFDDIEIDQ